MGDVQEDVQVKFNTLFFSRSSSSSLKSASPRRPVPSIHGGNGVVVVVDGISSVKVKVDDKTRY